MNTTKLIIAAAMVLATAQTFADTAVTYDSSDPQATYADGAVAVSYDGDGAITAITADTDAAGAVSFSGDAMTLSPSGANLSVAPAGSLSFANALNATGASSSSPSRCRVSQLCRCRPPRYRHRPL